MQSYVVEGLLVEGGGELENISSINLSILYMVLGHSTFNKLGSTAGLSH
jgi:hypothetical protein